MDAAEAEIVLLGDPVAQSKSPDFQNAGLAAIGSPWHYAAVRVDAPGVTAFADRIREGRTIGANVTAPHKGVALAAADRSTEIAALLGSANVLLRDPGGAVVADNTDVIGISASLDWLDVRGGCAVVLGAGGAAAAAAWAAGSRGLEVCIVARRPEAAAALTSRLSGSDQGSAQTWAAWGTPAASAAVGAAAVVINATSAGLSGPARDLWAGLGLEGSASAFLDLSYGAPARPFLSWAPAGRRAADGATMLLHQGMAAFELWTGEAAPAAPMRSALAAALGRDRSTIG